MNLPANAPVYALKSRGFTTQRQWRQAKRAELRAVKAAFDTYRFGCAFTPAGDSEVAAIDGALKSLTTALAANTWR